MASPTRDSFIDHHDYSSTITNQQQQGQGGQGRDGGDVGSPTINNPVIGFGSSSSPDPTQPNHESQTPTSTEVEPSQTPPVLLSPTPPFTSSPGGGNVCAISTSHVIYNDLLPPPPFIPPAASSFVGSSGRKREWPRDEYPSGDGESTPRKLLRSGDHEKPPIRCVVCGREFTRDKAYFGHLRKHPDRQWRGAYPPMEVGKLGPTLLELANQTIARLNVRSGPSSTNTSYSSSRGSLGINLNNPPPPPSTSAADDGAPLPFDLNKLPPPEINDDEEEDPDNGHQPAQ
ncbi:uncharacterized protein C6orf132 homolog [Tripterygium wilfordii]|uniref:uncharacterized protein C6orf132 homolog n=1 Tax=Tripterygium wilfordii TaxID=458696 RepID=UPI0018F82507|nr:uncharacterized protein C6orf132 homolog [Tripterygium wilfordii]